MLGWSRNKQHRKYTAFRSFVIERLESEGRWPPREHDDQLDLLQDLDRKILVNPARAKAPVVAEQYSVITG